nr:MULTISPECIES: hypothetical protein [Myxococcaceae]
MQTLLELREGAQGEAERALAEAVRALALQEARERELSEALERAREARARRVEAQHAQALAGGADAGALSAMNGYLRQLASEEAVQVQALQRQREAVAQAQQALEARREALAEAAREHEVLQRHRERWELERRRAREAREEQAQEEVGSALFLARRRP